MPELESLTEIGKAVGGLVKLAREEGWLDKLRAALKRKPKVLLMGCTGAGKTVFLDSLSKDVVPQAIDLLHRTQTIDHRKVKVSSQPFIFTDVPGEDPKKSERLKAIRMLAGERPGTVGIINVTAYGYHELRHHKPLIKRGQVIDKDFLAARRQAEIEAAQEWTTLLCGREGVAGWLITLVTKADLWWSQRDTVLAHYEKGAYVQALGEAQSLNHIVLPYCSVIQMFYGEGEVSGRFQDRNREEAKAHLIDTLLKLTGKARLG